LHPNVAAPLLAANQLLGATILGLRKYLVQVAFVLIASGIDIASVFIIYYRFEAQNNEPIAYEIMASRVVMFIILIIYFYRPSMRRRYKMFPLKFDGDILKRFMVDSGFLFARGVVIMATYFGSPVAASRLGTTQLDAHSIMSNLYFYPVLIGDSIGMACNIVGSRFIGQRKFASFRRLVLYASLAASFISIVFVCVYPLTDRPKPIFPPRRSLDFPFRSFSFFRFTFGRDIIFRSFTADAAIIDAAMECWWIVIGTAAMAPFVGVFEGLAMSRHYFKVLFFCVFAAVGGVYLPILIYNGLQAHMLPYIWAAIIGLELVRGAPVIIAVLWGLRGDPKRDEVPSLDSTEPYMTEEERAALLSSAPHSINGGDDEYASLPYPDGPPK
jgi:Na+-driven multidrug efflux pump